MDFHLAPNILDMFELCMSGQALRIFRRSSLAHTMNAFIGLLMCGLLSASLFACLTIFASLLSSLSLKLASGPAHTAKQKKQLFTTFASFSSFLHSQQNYRTSSIMSFPFFNKITRNWRLTFDCWCDGLLWKIKTTVYSLWAMKSGSSFPEISSLGFPPK